MADGSERCLPVRGLIGVAVVPALAVVALLCGLAVPAHASDRLLIGRITTAGVITEYVLPTGLPASSDIASGPDGALWFVEGATNEIGRITTAGVITGFPIP